VLLIVLIIIIIIKIIITEHLILRPEMQANSKAHTFLLPIILALKQMIFLKVERKIEQSRRVGGNLFNSTGPLTGALF